MEKQITNVLGECDLDMQNEPLRENLWDTVRGMLGQTLTNLAALL